MVGKGSTTPKCQNGYDLDRHPCPQTLLTINPRSLTDVVQDEKQQANIERTWGKKQTAISHVC